MGGFTGNFTIAREPGRLQDPEAFRIPGEPLRFKRSWEVLFGIWICDVPLGIDRYISMGFLEILLGLRRFQGVLRCFVVTLILQSGPSRFQGDLVSSIGTWEVSWGY